MTDWAKRWCVACALAATWLLSGTGTFGQYLVPYRLEEETDTPYEHLTVSKTRPADYWIVLFEARPIDVTG